MRPLPFDVSFDFAPYRFSGTVVGVVAGHHALFAQMGDAAHAPPYRAPPHGVVLYVKPANTFVGRAQTVEPGVDGAPLLAGAALGIVIGRSVCNVGEQEAADCIAGYLVAADFTGVTSQHHRPQVRAKARDRSLAVSAPVRAASVANADALAVRVRVDGSAVHETSTGGTVRSIARLVADVSEFMTLAPGDVLLAGVAPGAPEVSAGCCVDVEIDGIGMLHVQLDRAAARMYGT